MFKFILFMLLLATIAFAPLWVLVVLLVIAYDKEITSFFSNIFGTRNVRHKFADKE